MTDRPQPLERLDGYFAAARIAHEYISDLHRELVELDAADEHTRELLHEPVAVTLERMPTVTRRLRALEREWAEQELLDPLTADRTIRRLEDDLADVMPAIAELRARQNQIAAKLFDRVSRAR
jgi:hypothetical protein